jgi:hypothetical protein
MTQRLMGRLHLPWLNAGRHRLHVLASAGQQQARAVVPEQRGPISVPKRAGQRLDVGAKA